MAKPAIRECILQYAIPADYFMDERSPEQGSYAAVYGCAISIAAYPVVNLIFRKGCSRMLIEQIDQAKPRSSYPYAKVRMGPFGSHGLNLKTNATKLQT